MTLSLRSKPVQIIVKGTTDLDVSEMFLSLSIGGNALDDSGWYKPRGQIVLGVPQELGSGGLAVEMDGVFVPIVQGQVESFDCRVNPGRWAPGTIVEVSVWLDGAWVPLPWQLRILAYPNRPMPGNQRITLEVGSDADLLNYRAPEGAPNEDEEYGTPSSAQFLINRALSQAGAPELVEGSTIDTLRLPFSPEKNTGGSWITYAGSVAYAARHVLWQRTDGRIVPTPVELEGLEPVAAYEVGTNEADYILEAPGEQPPEIVEVQGTTYQIGTVEDESYVTEEIIDGVLVRTIVSYRDRDTFSPEYEERVEMPANVVLPLQSSSTDLIAESRLLKTTNYNADTAILESEVEEIYRPVAVVFPGSIWATPQILIVAERVTVTYAYDSRNVMLRRTTEKEVATILGLTVTTKVDSVSVEEWKPSQVTLSNAAQVPGEEYFFSRTQVNFNQDTARPPGLRGNASTNNTPPETQYRPSEKQRNESAYKGTAKFTNAVGSSYAEKKWVISLPSGMGVSTDQCRAHAALWGKVRQGRQFQIKWSGELTADWLTNFSPVRRVDFTLNGITTAYLVEGFNVSVDQRSAAVGGLGLEIGEVDGANVIPPYVQLADFVLAQSMGRMGADINLTQPNALSIAQTMGRLGANVDISLTDAVVVAQSTGRMGANLSIEQVTALTLIQSMGRMGADVTIAPFIELTLAQSMQRMGADISIAEPAWTPAQLTTALWLDASDNATLFDATSGGSLPAADGGVARWEDKSGNARHLTQATSGLRPIRKVANQNGLDGVQFNSASTHWIENASATFGLVNRTAFVVFKENSAVANSGLLIIKPTAGQNDFGVASGVGDGYYFGPSNRTSARVGVGGSNFSSAATYYEILDTASPASIIPVSIYAELKSGSTGTLYRNGTSVATDNSFTEFAATSGGGVSLGARYTPTRQGPYFNGVVYEVLYLESALSTDNFNRVIGYFAHKWGTTASLAADHPYKTVAP